MTTIKSYTDLDQSRKLAEFLPLESADGFYAENVIITEPFITYLNGERNIPAYKGAIPCWSLAALLELIPNYQLQTQDNGIGILFGHKKGFEEVTAKCPIDACVAMIEKLYEQNFYDYAFRRFM